MSVKKRMTISFGIVTLFSSIAAIVAIFMLLRVDARFDKALHLNGFIQGDIGHYATYLNEERILIRDIVMLQDKAVVAQKKEELAVGFLKEKGVRILDRNYYFPGSGRRCA